jgi:hypothetical protein
MYFHVFREIRVEIQTKNPHFAGLTGDTKNSEGLKYMSQAVILGMAAEGGVWKCSAYSLESLSVSPSCMYIYEYILYLSPSHDFHPSGSAVPSATDVSRQLNTGGSLIRFKSGITLHKVMNSYVNVRLSLCLTN